MAVNTAGFTGKVAFVTGGGAGIGRATALTFGREGASVVVTDMNVEDAQETARLIEERGSKALALACDVTSSAQVQAALKQTMDTFGRLDYAFNNAGVEPKESPIADMEEAEWHRVINANLNGVFYCMKYEIPLLLAQGGGVIVNTSSSSGVKAFPNQVSYQASKRGVIGLTKGAALEYATQNIRVNAVCPGIINTPMMDRFSGGTPEGRAKVIAQEPIGRMGEPEEIANAVIWMCSDAAAFMTGHAMVVDGGQTL